MQIKTNALDLSRFLINKLDFFKAITLIIANVLRVLPYFITLLNKNYPR